MTADKPIVTAIFQLADTGPVVDTLDYKPVPKSFAALHGRLGQPLHFNYFARNQSWSPAERAATPGDTTLLDARDVIARGIDGLADITSGQLLGSPRVRDVANEVLGDPHASGPAPDATLSDPGDPPVLA